MRSGGRKKRLGEKSWGGGGSEDYSLPDLESSPILLAGRHGLLGHRQHHRDHHVIAGDRGEIDDLLIVEDLLGPRIGLVGDLLVVVSSVTKSYTTASSSAIFDRAVAGASSSAITSADSSGLGRERAHARTTRPASATAGR